jgi:hypothetical protein
VSDHGGRSTLTRVSPRVSHPGMAECECCRNNPGEVREWETRVIPTNQGDVRRRVPLTTLCDTCNDGQFPYHKPTGDGGEILACPHDV